MSASFAPPPQVSLQMIIQVLYIIKRRIQLCNGDETKFLVSACQFLLLPSMSQFDQPAKNLMRHVAHAADLKHMHLMVELFLGCLRSMKLNSAKRHLNDRTILARTLLELVGGGEPFKMKFPKEIDNAFALFRSKLTEHHSYTFSRAADRRRSFEWLSVRDIHSALHDVLAALSQSAVPEDSSSSAKDPHMDIHDMKASSLFSSYGVLNEFDCLVATSLRLTNCCSEFGRIVDLMSVPMLTLKLSPSFVKTTWIAPCPKLETNCEESLFQRVITSFVHSRSVISSHFSGHRSHSTIGDAHFALGNVVSFCRFITIDKSDPEHISDRDLQLYFDTCSHWLLECPHPDILTGRKGILWNQIGSSLTAVAIPDGLEEQILSWLKPELLLSVFTRILTNVALAGNGWEVAVSAKDVEEVQQALSSNSYTITKRALKTVEQENTWFTSKWAQKVTASVVQTLSAPFASKNSSAPSTSGKMAASLNCLNYPLIGSLGKFWAILLTEASMAAVNSVPRKALIMLTFASNTAEKLWIAFLLSCNMNSDGFARNSSINDLFSHARLDSVGTQKDDNMAFSILIAFVAVFRAHLITLDDSELYDKEVAFTIPFR